MIKKIFAEIRYPIQINLIDGRPEKIRMFSPSEFKHWQITPISQDQSEFKFFNEEKVIESKEIFGFTPSNMVFRVEDAPTANYFPDRFSKLIKKATKLFETDICKRVGIRTWSLFNIRNMDDFVTANLNNGIFNDKFTSQFQGSSKIEDIGVIFESSKYKAQFGPLKYDKNQNYVAQTIQKDKLGDYFFYADIDTFKKDVSLKNISYEIKSLVDLNNSISETIISNLGGLE